MRTTLSGEAALQCAAGGCWVLVLSHTSYTSSQWSSGCINSCRLAVCLPQESLNYWLSYYAQLTQFDLLILELRCTICLIYRCRQWLNHLHIKMVPTLEIKFATCLRSWESLSLVTVDSEPLSFSCIVHLSFIKPMLMFIVNKNLKPVVHGTTQSELITYYAWRELGAAVHSCIILNNHLKIKRHRFMGDRHVQHVGLKF